MAIIQESQAASRRRPALGIFLLLALPCLAAASCGDDTTGDGDATTDADGGDLGGDGSGETIAGCGGALGCPCDDDAACATGACLPTGDGSACAGPCDSGDCPDGWACTELDGSPQCVPLYARACFPCASDDDCTIAGEVGGRCLQDGDSGGGFCGALCDDGACPDGFSCLSRATLAGDTIKQCVPTDGQCECSDAAVAEAASTSCTVSNDAGTCSGQRTCTASGLTACDAQTPAVETCDGSDNDCDGDVDEDSTETCEVANAFGSCSGVRACVSGALDACNAATPSAEICDGIDNDCNGLIDDGPVDTDGDGLSDDCDPDDDNDLVADELDNCPTVANPLQAECDLDGLGNACDDDDDDDGAADAIDCSPCDPFYFPGQADICDELDNDCDGVADEDCQFQLGVPFGFGNGFQLGATDSSYSVQQTLGLDTHIGVSTNGSYTLRTLPRAPIGGTP